MNDEALKAMFPYASPHDLLFRINTDVVERDSAVELAARVRVHYWAKLLAEAQACKHPEVPHLHETRKAWNKAIDEVIEIIQRMEKEV